MTEAPDFIEPVLGFRTWDLRSDGFLRPYSRFGAAPWRPGVNEATCHAAPASHGEGHREHRAPHPTCRCGLYALHSLRTPQLLPSLRAVGAIAAWGDLEVHHTGFRAQYACVIGLVEPRRAYSTPDLLRSLKRAAERYGVPLLAERDLEASVREHATPLSPGAPRRNRARKPRRRASPRLCSPDGAWEEPPRYANARDCYAVIDPLIEEMLAARPGLRGHLAKLDLVVSYRLASPAAEVTFDMTAGSTRIICGSAHPPCDLAFELPTATAERYWRGELDIVAALRRREIKVEGAQSRALSVCSVMSSVFRTPARPAMRDLWPRQPRRQFTPQQVPLRS